MVPAAVLAVIGIPILLVLIWVIAHYNRFVRLRQHIRESWAGIDVELKRRYQLIPNLVTTVKGYAQHERQVLESVMELRSRAMQSVGSAAEQAVDESALQGGLQRVFVLAEGYPTLRADEHFLALQKELALTENRIAASRRFYNGNVREMAQLCEMFPSSILASMFGFESGSYFELKDELERVVPAVKMQ